MTHARTLLASSILVLSLPSSAASITTPEIIARTSQASFACLNWRATGLCLWLDCGPFGCQVRSSLKVGHYNPDLVVSSYNILGDNPWLEIRTTLGIAQATAARSALGTLTDIIVGSAGNRTEGTDRRDHKNLVFRETDAIGHPGLNFSLPVLPASLRCVSQALPFNEKPGTYPNKNGPRYRNLANLKEVKAVFHILALAMVAPAKAAMHTGGVILESCDSQ